MTMVEEIRDVGALARWRAGWEALEAQSEAALGLFHSHLWTTTWLEAFWPRRPLSMLMLVEGRSLRAVAPLVHDRSGELYCPGCRALPVNDHVCGGSVLCPGALDPALTRMLDHLRGRHPRDPLVFKELVRDGPLHRDLERYARRRGAWTTVRHASYSPWLDLRDGFAAYLDRRSRHLRRELRRKRNKLGRAGVAEVHRCQGDRALGQLLEGVLQVERNSWKAGHGSAISSRPELEQFYLQLARRCHRRGWLRAYLLTLDGEPVAHIFAILYRGTLYALKTSFDERYRQLSPGAVLFGHAIEQSCREGVQRLALLGTRSRWKDELADSVSEQVTLCLFPRSRLRCSTCRLLERELRPRLGPHVRRLGDTRLGRLLRPLRLRRALEACLRRLP